MNNIEVEPKLINTLNPGNPMWKLVILATPPQTGNPCKQRQPGAKQTDQKQANIWEETRKQPKGKKGD